MVLTGVTSKTFELLESLPLRKLDKVELGRIDLILNLLLLGGFLLIRAWPQNEANLLILGRKLEKWPHIANFLYAYYSSI